MIVDGTGLRVVQVAASGTTGADVEVLVSRWTNLTWSRLPADNSGTYLEVPKVLKLRYISQAAILNLTHYIHDAKIFFER